MQQPTVKKTRLKSLFILVTPRLTFEIKYFEECYVTTLWLAPTFLMEKTSKCSYTDSTLYFQRLKYITKPFVSDWGILNNYIFPSGDFIPIF